MSDSSQPAIPIAVLMDMVRYQQTRSAHFPSAGSLEWYVRTHKAELVSRGALLKHRGIWHVHAERFDRAVLDIAQAAAA